MGTAPLTPAPPGGDAAAPPSATRPPSAIRTGIFYSAAHYAGALLTSVAGFLVRLWVPASVFGAAAIVTGVQEYFRAYDGLYRNAVDREVPVHQARGDEAAAEDVLRASYVLLLASLVLESAVLAALALLADDPLMRLAWTAYAVVNLLDGVGQMDRIALKATQRFGAHNRALVLGGLAGSAALVAASYLWGAPGYFGGVAANAAVLFVAYRREMPGPWRLPALGRVTGPVVRRVLAVGSGVALMKLGQQLLFTADRWVVAHHFGIRELGYYSLGLALASRLYLLPQTLAGSFSPRLNGMLGTGRLDEAGVAVEKLQRATCLISACTCGAVILAVEPVVARFLPAYGGAVPAIRMLLAATYFMAMNATSLQVHVGMERTGRGVAAAAVATAGSVAVGGWLAGLGLVGVAAGRAVGLGVYAVAMDLSTRRLLPVRGMVGSALAGAAALAVLLGLLHLWGTLAAAAWLAGYGALSLRALAATFGMRVRDLPAVLRRRRPPPG
jgi:O-antigen/teichoic acid export membrane protein